MAKRCQICGQRGDIRSLNSLGGPLMLRMLLSPGFFDFCEGFSRELRELREWAAPH